MLAKRFLLAVILFFMICLALAETNQTTKVIINPPNMKGMKMSAQSQNISNIKINKFEYGNLYYGDLSQDEINNLVSQGYQVQPDKVFHILLQNSIPLINANYSRNLQISEDNLTGQGQTVCIIDTGVNYSHPDLGNCTQSEFLAGNCSKVIGGWDFVNNNNNPMDDNGHGTHVSGIVAAEGSIKGVAPDAKIVALKVLDSGGSGYSQNIINAIGWCVSNSSKFNISVISMSLGGGENYTSYCDNDDLGNQAFAVAINAAAAKNISVVVSSGNSGSSTQISSPACITNATAVGSSTKTDAISSFSNRNAIVSLIAPGTLINSTEYLGAYICSHGAACDGNYASMSGTSMAAPHVSGAIAILNQELVLTSQTKTNKEIEAILNLTGKLIYDSSSNRNYSRINLLNATLYLDNISPNITLISPLNNSINLTQTQFFSCNFTDWQLENMSFYLWNSTGLVYNETRDVSGTSNLSEFNVSNLSYNNYIWSCKVYDKKNNFAFSYNFSFAVSGVSTNLVYPENANYTNNNQTIFGCQSQTDTSSGLTNMSFYLWNSTGLVYNETRNVSGTSNLSEFTYSFSEEGNYFWNCLSINNNSNFSWGVLNYTITYDITNPFLELIAPFPADETSSSSLKLFYFNVTDSYNVSCKLIINNAINLITNISEFNLTYNFSQTFSAGTYNWKINCTDLARNSNLSETKTFTITAPSSDSGASASSNSPGGGPSSNVYAPTIEQSNSGYTKELNPDDKIKFTIFDEKSETHTITLNKIGDNFVELTVASNPINVKLGIGQSIKLNLTSSDYYNLYIKLESILNGKAKITMQTINEVIIKSKDENIINQTGNQNNKTIQQEKKDYFWYIVIGCVFIVFIVAIVIHLFESREREIEIKEIKKKLNKKNK